jgi:hypothetical protein
LNCGTKIDFHWSFIEFISSEIQKQSLTSFQIQPHSPRDLPEIYSKVLPLNKNNHPWNLRNRKIKVEKVALKIWKQVKSVSNSSVFVFAIFSTARRSYFARKSELKFTQAKFCFCRTRKWIKEEERRRTSRRMIQTTRKSSLLRRRR